MRILSILSIALLLPAVFAGRAAAESALGRGGEGRGGFRALMADLNLTDSQRDTIRKTTDGLREQLHADRREMFNAKKVLAAEVLEDKVDEVKIKQGIAEILKTQEKLLLDRTKLLTEISGVLTAEQRQILRSKTAEKFEKWSGAFGRGERAPGGDPSQPELLE